MRELLQLEINDDIAAQEPVVEDEVEEVVVAIEGESLLPCFEEEALAEFEQKLFKMGDQCGFKIGLGIAGLLVEAEEFEHERLFEEVFGLGDELPFAGEPFDSCLVAAESETLVKAGGFLATEFRFGPTFVGGLDLVEATLLRILDSEEHDVMGPTDSEWVVQFNRTLLLNHQLVRRLLTHCG
jgi:hypothetical protein